MEIQDQNTQFNNGEWLFFSFLQILLERKTNFNKEVCGMRDRFSEGYEQGKTKLRLVRLGRILMLDCEVLSVNFLV